MTLAPPRIALVLGAGGVPGGAYIRAAMAELEAITGWVPASATTVVGTSVGALNAARLPLPDVAPMPTAAQLASLGGLGRRLPPPDSSVLTSVIARIRLAGGQVAARLAPAGSHPQDYDVAQAPYHPGVMAVSVQRRGGRRRIARLVEATSPEAELYASAAVPGYVSPVVVDGEEHIDGAVWSSTNADLIGLDDHDGLVVIAPMAARSGGNLLARSHRAQLIAELRPWVASGKPLVVVSPTGEEQTLRPDHSAFAAAAVRRVRSAHAENPSDLSF